MFNTIKVNNTDTNYTHSIFDISDYTGNQYENLSPKLIIGIIAYSFFS